MGIFMLHIDLIVRIPLIDLIVAIAHIVHIHQDHIAVMPLILLEATAAIVHIRQAVIAPIHQEAQPLVAFHPEAVAVNIA